MERYADFIVGRALAAGEVLFNLFLLVVVSDKEGVLVHLVDLLLASFPIIELVLSQHVPENHDHFLVEVVTRTHLSKEEMGSLHFLLAYSLPHKILP